MSTPRRRIFVNNTAVATSSSVIGAGSSVSQRITTGFPIGVDALVHSFKIRHSGNLNLSTSSAGTLITRGGLIAIPGIWLQDPQHGVLYNNVDALSLHKLNYMKRGVRPINSDISAATTGTPSFDYSLELQFRDKADARPDNASLDLLRVSYMELMLNIFGPAATNPSSAWISGGTYTTETLQVENLEVSAVQDAGPIAEAAMPLYQVLVEEMRVPINQTQTSFAIFLPYGGRLVKRYLIEQRNGLTGNELANTVVGVNDQDRISLLVANYPWIQRQEWLAFQDIGADEAELANGMPTGTAVINWPDLDAGGFVPPELMPLNNPQGGAVNVELDVDVTSVTNGQLYITSECYVPIAPDAKRAAKEGAASGKK